jgi:hypothetical protein
MAINRDYTQNPIGPRFTVSVHTVLRSTSGAAGFRRDMPTVAAAKTTTATADQMIWRRRFCRLNSGRAISIYRELATLGPQQHGCYMLNDLGLGDRRHRFRTKNCPQTELTSKHKGWDLRDESWLREHYRAWRTEAMKIGSEIVRPKGGHEEKCSSSRTNDVSPHCPPSTADRNCLPM